MRSRRLFHLGQSLRSPIILTTRITQTKKYMMHRHHILLWNLGDSSCTILARASLISFCCSGVATSVPSPSDLLFFFLMGLFQRLLAPALSVPASSSSRSVGRPTFHQTLRAALASAAFAFCQHSRLQ